MGTPNTIDADRLKLIDRLATLPAPDFMHPHKLSDPIGSDSSYRASTVARLIEQAVAAERERCARLCDWLPVGTGLQGKTFAEAIRGTGMGGDLAKGFEA